MPRIILLEMYYHYMQDKKTEIFNKIEKLMEISPNILNHINALCNLYDKRINASYEEKCHIITSKLQSGAVTISEIYQESRLPYKQIKLIIEQLIEEGKVEVRYAPKQRGGQLKPGRKAKMFFIKERKD